MKTIDEILELKKYYVDELYQNVRNEQSEDETFYHDTFHVPQVKPPLVVSRTGSGRLIVDNPTEQISAGKIIAIRPIDKTNNQTAEDAANQISRMVNQDWVPLIESSNPNPKKSFIKYQLLRGEAWLHPIHNEKWVVTPMNRTGLPVLLPSPDPVTIFASPEEDSRGVPKEVFVYYDRIPWAVKSKYPGWSNPKLAGTKDGYRTVKWMEYWNHDTRYFEADGEAVLKNMKNIYGFTPFVHKVSGFGIESTGKLEDLIVSMIRPYRDLLIRECAITSAVDNVIHMFANKNIDVQPDDDQHTIPDNFRRNYKMGYGVIHELPPGITVTPAVTMLPDQQMFQYLYTIDGKLRGVLPDVFQGIAVGQTGRLQDMAYSVAMKRYQGIARNTELALSTALEMALEMCDRIPGLRPDGISKDDFRKYYTVNVELKEEDVIESDRLSALGSRLYERGEIDLMTNLVKYQGYTQDEAAEIMINLLVDKVTFQDPAFAALMGQQLAQEAGMFQQYQQLQAQTQALSPQTKPGSQGGEPRRGNIKTERGREEIDMSLAQRGGRRSPA